MPALTRLNEEAPLLNAKEYAFQFASMLGVRSVLPAKCNCAVELFAGAEPPLQLAPVDQFEFEPLPFQVADWPRPMEGSHAKTSAIQAHAAVLIG